MNAKIGLDAVSGLHHLHQRDITHRDLKSLNILLDLSYRAKLADFGLTTLKTSSASSTTAGFKGTVQWSAPELFEPDAEANPTSDIYSFGMVLWELATRQVPFAKAASVMVALSWITKGHQEKIPDTTPGELKALIIACWNKEPSKRPKTDEVAKQLDSLWQAERKKTLAITPPSPRQFHSYF